MGWIGKLLGGGDGRKEAAQAQAHVPDAPPEDAPVPALAIDAAWYGWLLGGGIPDASDDAGAPVLARLARLADDPESGAALVPRVPEIVPELMRILRDDDMNVAVLARQLARDPVLVAEVYREANRPAYRPRYHAGPPVNSIDAAVMLLGQNGMRMLLVRVAFRPVVSMQSGRLAQRAAALIWRQSEKCALAASILAPTQRASVFDAYLSGLMQNVGLVVAFRLLDQLGLEAPLPRSDAFVGALFAQARALSARIAALWEFPEAVATTIADIDADTALAHTLERGDRLSKLRMLIDAGYHGADDPFVLNGLDKAERACLERLADDEDEA